MKNIMMLLAALTLLTSTSMNAGAFPEEMKDQTGQPIEDGSRWIGTSVMNIQGEKLGTIHRFVWDSNGKVIFAIVSREMIPGMGVREVAVPYSAITYDKERRYFICDISMDQFTMAPAFENEAELHDPHSAEMIYRYFGQSPYWTPGPRSSWEERETRITSDLAP